MEKLFTPHEQSLDMKSIGFDEPCLTYYHENKILESEIVFIKGSKFWNLPDISEIAAPTYSQAFSWFREKYGLKHDIDDDNIGTKFYYRIKSFTDKFDNYHDISLLIRKELIWSEIEFYSYRAAELACLKKLIQIVKQKL